MAYQLHDLLHTEGAAAILRVDFAFGRGWRMTAVLPQLLLPSVCRLWEREWLKVD